MPPFPGTETILIVDDEAAVVSLAALMLERYGYEVMTAPSGAEALHLFEVWPDLDVDLVMVDIVMPEMNGVELAERLRLIRPDLPVLYFSAYSYQDLLGPIFRRNLPYLPKPFTSAQLTKKIREVLDNPKTKSAGAEQD
jgi:CheY-like chemotaxis protein